jgi:bifunctional DNase/RNase
MQKEKCGAFVARARLWYNSGGLRGDANRTDLSAEPTSVGFGGFMIQVSIDSIRVSLISHHRVVVLKDKHERFLPIWIGPFEADAITIALQGNDVARPLTHDLMRDLIVEGGMTASHIFVSDLREDTFFARIVLDVRGRHVEIDARPSDAIALAVRLKVPIYVEDTVMERAAIVPSPAVETVTPEEEEKLAAFRDVIEDLDLSDLGSEGEPPKAEA